MADKDKPPPAYQYELTLSAGPFREPHAEAISYDYFVNRKGWLIPRVMRIFVDLKGELEPFQQKILGLSGGSPGQQLKLTHVLTRKIAEQKAQIVLAEGRIEQASEILVRGFAEHDSYLFPKLEEWMMAAKDQVREQVRTQIGL